MRSQATSPATQTRARKSWCRCFAAEHCWASWMSTARVRTASIRTMRAASRGWWRNSSKPPTWNLSLLRGREHGLRVIERRKDALEILDLRQIVVLDVEGVRMMHQIVLVIALGRIKSFERL